MILPCLFRALRRSDFRPATFGHNQRRHPERLTKSAVCSDDTKVLIEDEKGIPDRIHDPLGERVHIIDVDDQFPIGRGQGVRGGRRSR